MNKDLIIKIAGQGELTELPWSSQESNEINFLKNV